ncbi:hypothetical protein J3U99_05710 [Brucella pituitosa]|uniref:hypothetical protein n=1 Tax=Brucella pituitosa TaxID=571256 RepID=UPI002004E623|nr:hypothetical protein [Brucella pituitosa]MCK4204257.1 hypothetical protein [Brucella pituitosa]
MTDEDIDTFDKLVKIANSEHDGHLAILKFTTNWRVGFVTPEDREMISEMAVGDTFAEAATHALYPPKKD